jgi:hypothetical protein
LFGCSGCHETGHLSFDCKNPKRIIECKKNIWVKKIVPVQNLEDNLDKVVEKGKHICNSSVLEALKDKEGDFGHSTGR